MKTSIQLIKTSSEMHLLHLYEHMYLKSLYNFLQQNQVFNFLDYDLEASTHAGYTILEVSAYSQEAAELLEGTAHLAIATDTGSIYNAMAEIVAEMDAPLGGDMDNAKRGLEKLNSQPWTRLDDITFYHPGPQSENVVFKKKFKTLNLDQSRVRTKELLCRLSLDKQFAKQNRHLLPLFHVLAIVLQNNHLQELASRYQYYSTGYGGIYKNGSAHMNYYFDAWMKHRPALTTELATCRAALQNLFETGVLERINELLQNVDYALPGVAPNSEEIVYAMNTLVGAAGWRLLADINNIREVVKHTSLELRYGKEKQSFKLSTILT